MLAAIATTWISHQLKWIRQRQDVVANYPVSGPLEGVRAPGLLWLFGEPSVECVYMRASDKKERLRLQRPFHEQEEKEEVQRIQQLFPEATIRFP